MSTFDLTDIKTWLAKQFPDLIGAYLFGSFATGDQRQDSNIDIAILIPRKIDEYELWEKAQELRQLMDRDVDLINLISANTVFQFEII